MKPILLALCLLFSACANDVVPARVAPSSVGIESTAESSRQMVKSARKLADSHYKTALSTTDRDGFAAISFALQDVERENDKLAAEILKYKGEVAVQTQELSKLSDKLNSSLALNDKLRVDRNHAVLTLWKWRILCWGTWGALLIGAAGLLYIRTLKPL